MNRPLLVILAILLALGALAGASHAQSPGSDEVNGGLGDDTIAAAEGDAGRSATTACSARPGTTR